MQWKSSLAVIASLLLSAGDLVVAQITAPVCTATGFSWAYNSLNQNPCMVTAYLMSTCYGGSFVMASLGIDVGYAGPSITEVTQAAPCWCNTVVYSLASACSECQGGESIEWSQYKQYCITVPPPSTFPNPVPGGTAVPQWALVAISGTSYWSPSTAQSVGDSPEIIPGELINTPAVVPTTSHTVAPQPTTPFNTPTIVEPSFTLPSITLPSTTKGPFSGSGSLGSGGSKRVASAGGLVWGVTAMAAISGLVLTLIPRLV